DMFTNIQQYYSRVRTSDFNLFNRQNRVYIQAEPQHMEEPKSLESIYVRNKNDDMVPLSTLTTLKKVFGPEIVTRFNLYNSVEVEATAAKGYSSADAMDDIEEVTAHKLPGIYQFEWTG